MSLRQKAARGVFWSATRLWGAQASNLLVFLILSRLLGPEAFGLVALASVFTALFQIFVDQGFSAAIVQATRLDRVHLDTAFWTSMLIGVLLTLAGIASSGLVAAFFREPQLAPVVSLLSLNFLFLALNGTQQAILQRDLAFKKLAARTLIAKAIGGGVSVAMALAGCGVWSLVAESLVGNLIAVVVLWRASAWRPGFNVAFGPFKEMFAFGIHIVGGKLLEYLSRRSDDLLIGYVLGVTALGYYSVAYRLLLIMTYLLTRASNSVAFPTFARLKDDPERMRRAFYTVSRLTVLVAFPAFLGVAALAPELITVLFGATWAPSAPVMQVLALMGILHALLAFNYSVIVAAGKPAWRLALLAIQAVANVIAFALAVRWGIVAVAAAYVLVGYLLAPLSLLAVHRLITIDWKRYLGHYLAPLPGALVMVAVVAGLSYALPAGTTALMQLLVCIPVGVITYLGIIQFMAPALARQAREMVALALPVPKWGNSRLKRGGE